MNKLNKPIYVVFCMEKDGSTKIIEYFENYDNAKEYLITKYVNCYKRYYIVKMVSDECWKLQTKQTTFGYSSRLIERRDLIRRKQ